MRRTLGRTLWLLAAVLALGVGRAAMAAATAAPEGHVVEVPEGAAEHAAGAGHDEPTLINPPAKGLVTAITTLAIFVLLLVVLGRFAWGPIATGLKAREDKIRKDIADAEAARERAEATLREYTGKLDAAQEEFRKMLADAHAEGEKQAAAIRLHAQQEGEEIKERAMRDIDAARKQAVAEIHEQTADLATRVAEKILRRTLNADDQRDLVESSLDQLERLNRA